MFTPRGHVVTRKLASPGFPLLVQYSIAVGYAHIVSKFIVKKRDSANTLCSGCTEAQGDKLSQFEHEDMAVLWGVLGSPQSIWQTKKT